MKNARFWTGLVFCTGLPLSLVMGTTAGFTRYSLVEGSLTYNGQAVNGGLVLFQSLDRKQSPDMIALIDESGHFQGRAEWPLDSSGRVQFRLHLFPDPRELREIERAAKEGHKPPTTVIAPAPPDSPPARDLSGTAKAVLGMRGGPVPPSLGGPVPPSLGGPVSASVAGPPAPDGGASAAKSPRWLPEIWLAPEPTRIDIDLKD